MIVKLLIENNNTNISSNNLKEAFYKTKMSDNASNILGILGVMIDIKTIGIENDIKKWLSENELPYFTPRTYGYTNKLTKILVECGANISFNLFSEMKIDNILLVLLCGNTIVSDDKYFSLQDIIYICFLDKYIIQSPSIMFSQSRYLTDKKTLIPKDVLDMCLHQELVDNPIIEELFQDYLDERLWKPDRFILLPDSTRNRILYFMLAIKRFSKITLGCKIPKALLHMIINLFIINKRE